MCQYTLFCMKNYYFDHYYYYLIVLNVDINYVFCYHLIHFIDYVA